MKRALTVGINYVGTPSELRGCINDSKHIKALLEKQGFEVEECLEKAATTAGIKAALERLIKGAMPGDVLVFHYSGHGSQLPSRVEADGWEEIICPIDLDWMQKVITDDTLRSIFNRVPNGVNTTLILDCCHSGTALDQTETFKVQTREIVGEENSATEKRYLAPPAHVVADIATREMVQWSASRDVNASALLIAGCMSDQTSADAVIDGLPQGAATYALLASVNKNPKITYAQLITEMNDFMVEHRFTQRPQLDGASSLYDKTFLEAFWVAPADAPAPVQEPIEAPAPAPAPVPAPKLGFFAAFFAWLKSLFD